jgi:hypothetical protein
MIQDQYTFDKKYPGSVEELQEELSVLTLYNIKKYPEYKSKWDDFYSMWLRFGPEAARTILIPSIWEGKLPSPKVNKNARKG